MAVQRPAPIVVDASALAPDLTTIDALARLQLSVRRLGGRVKLRNVSDELQKLIAFVGLGDALRLEPGGEAEEREQRPRVEEERQLGDPPA